MERDFKILPSLNIIFDLNVNVIKIVSGNLMNVFIYGNAQIDERFFLTVTVPPVERLALFFHCLFSLSNILVIIIKKSFESLKPQNSSCENHFEILWDIGYCVTMEMVL